QISSMETKQPPGMFRTGHLKILLTSGETLQLIISKKNEYERILSLLQSFSPQALRQATWTMVSSHETLPVTRLFQGLQLVSKAFFFRKDSAPVSSETIEQLFLPRQ